MYNFLRLFLGLRGINVMINNFSGRNESSFFVKSIFYPVTRRTVSLTPCKHSKGEKVHHILEVHFPACNL